MPEPDPANRQLNPADPEDGGTVGESAAPAPRTGRRKRLLRIARDLGMMVLAVLAAGIAVTNFGTHTYHWRAFDIDVGIKPAMEGETRLVFAPLGEVRGRTHSTPVALNIALKGVQFEELKKLVLSPPPRRELEAEFTKIARSDLENFALRQILWGAVGALFVPLILRRKRAGWYLTCALAGGVFTAGMFLHAVRTFNSHAFENPTYTGSLREANWIIALVKDGFNKADTLASRLKQAAENLNTLYSRINEVPGLAADVDTIRVLHISDIHNNRAAVGFVQQLAEKSKVDFVIDTGDLTDLGLPVENELSTAVARLKVPYVFVPGNHDSQAIVAAMRTHPNVIVLDAGPVSVAGLTILGSPDPASFRTGIGSVDTPEESIRAAGDRLLQAFRTSTSRPDIVCVHNPRQAEALVGTASLILCGHMHRAYVETRSNTVICNAGTTGAAGVRYLAEKDGVALTAAIVAFAKNPSPRLLFIDQVRLDANLGSYSITRQSFNQANQAPRKAL